VPTVGQLQVFLGFPVVKSNFLWERRELVAGGNGGGRTEPVAVGGEKRARLQMQIVVNKVTKFLHGIIVETA
jgi:hypothetical protein